MSSRVLGGASKEVPAGTLIHELERRHCVDVSDARFAEVGWEVWCGGKGNEEPEGKNPQAWKRLDIRVTSSFMLGEFGTITFGVNRVRWRNSDPFKARCCVGACVSGATWKC